MKEVQLIWAHPRTDSLTARVAQVVKEELKVCGWSVAELDLYREGFNPVLQSADEPDWSTLDQNYSEEVSRLAADLNGKEGAFIVFPVWWFSAPAILKGYIDRVWNWGIAYGGDRKLPFDSVRWLALAGAGERTYTEAGLGKSMSDLLNIGIANYCGASDSEVSIFYDTLGGDAIDLLAHHAHVVEQARKVATDWAATRAGGKVGTPGSK